MPFIIALALSLLAGAVLAAALVFLGLAVGNGYTDIAVVMDERRKGIKRSDHLQAVAWGAVMFIVAAMLAAIVLLAAYFITWIWSVVQ